MSDPAKTPSSLRKVAAAVLDFFTIFLIAGYGIAKLTGNTTEDGFELHGLPALALTATLFIYFYVGGKYAGGTIWQRVLGTR